MFQFCPKCHSILRPKKENEKLVMYCSCGYSSASDTDGSLKEEKKVKKAEVDFEVVEKEVNTLPITKEECPNCGNKEAFYWLQQTRAGDEAETKFMKCTKCKHTWRDYS